MHSLSHNPFLPLGICIWITGYPELAFPDDLNISATESSGLQASYLAAYFICPLIIYGWIVRNYGFRVTFMTGKTGSSCISLQSETF